MQVGKNKKFLVKYETPLPWKRARKKGVCIVFFSFYVKVERLRKFHENP